MLPSDALNTLGAANMGQLRALVRQDTFLTLSTDSVSGKMSTVVSSNTIIFSREFFLWLFLQGNITYHNFNRIRINLPHIPQNADNPHKRPS